MLGDQNGCFEDVSLNILWSVVPHVPDDTIEAIAAELQRLGVLNAENKWQDFAGKLGKSEHTAYDKPVEKIVNNIIQITHKAYEVERQDMVASDEMAADDPQTDAPAGYAGPRLALKCNGKTTRVSEVPDSSKPDGSPGFTDTLRKSLTAVVKRDGKQGGKHEEEHDDRTHTENVLLCAQFKLHEEVGSNPLLRGCRDLLRLYRNTC
jgi:hypothetical protein